MQFIGTTKERLDRIEALLTTVLLQEGTLMAAAADLQTRIDALTTNVAADTSAVSSAITLLQGLSAEIAALKTGVTDPTQLAAIDALSSTVSAQAAALAAAVVANTPPAAPTKA